MIGDIKNFSFSEMTSNNSGKTSGSGFCGVYIVVLSVLSFIYGCFEFHWSGKADIMMYSSANIALGAALLGYRKSVDKTAIENGNDGIPKKDVSQNMDGGGDVPPQ